MKVIDLLNKIATKQIKRGTVIKWQSLEFLYDYPNCAGIYRVGKDTQNHNNFFAFLDSTSLDKEVEVIEQNQDIDIDSIEELKIDDKDKEFYSSIIINNRAKINELIQAVKQLDKKIEEA